MDCNAINIDGTLCKNEGVLEGKCINHFNIRQIDSKYPKGCRRCFRRIDCFYLKNNRREDCKLRKKRLRKLRENVTNNSKKDKPIYY